MPTYAPVPSSFTTLSHRAQALFLYRHILREGAKFFDERASLWVRSRAQEAFRKSKSLSDENRVQKSMSDARKALRLLERANQMDLKSVMRILRLSYGMLGRERQKLLKPFLDSTRARTLSPEKLSAAITQSASTNVPEIPQDSSQSTATIALPPSANISKYQLSAALSQLKKDPQPLHYNNPRTIPPILSPPVVSLIKDASGKSPEPILPEPLFKPLHGKREANLRWRFFTKQINKVTPPLPTEIRQEMERKSRVGLKNNEADGNGGGGPLPSHIMEGNWIEWEQRILNTIRAWNKNGKEQKEKSWETEIFHPSVGGKPARPNILTPRLYRRIWQRLLDEVPVLEVGVTTSKADVKNKTEGEEASSTLSSSPLLKPSFSITKSPLSYQARYSVGLKLHAKVNDFDQIGITEESVPPPSSKGRNKAPKTRP
ncbi:hypothetical protein BGZ80_002494 [Entomortierella chlamydospora]|uniref:LYR motif-containing protein Cup1-like N-terminal domain-containing protein n=1 Tax=Entomortierella chlamydospora TaxID=101097 RepID=A0A9P6MQ31_9FUNG|nr:hypothetical protein BGZ79_006722 [Entomortierella chlamydospora]KAG0009333.1 hypothetical protein BGZ80_002494 [Entomortierella chlamydospora]